MSAKRAKAKRRTLLRPSDIAWQAFQAGAALYEGYDVVHLKRQFKAWWDEHPQALPDGQLKEAS